MIGSVRDSPVNLLCAGILDPEFAPSSFFKHRLLLLEAAKPGFRLLKYYLDPIVQGAGIRQGRRSVPRVVANYVGESAVEHRVTPG